MRRRFDNCKLNIEDAVSAERVVGKNSSHILYTFKCSNPKCCSLIKMPKWHVLNKAKTGYCRKCVNTEILTGKTLRPFEWILNRMTHSREGCQLTYDELISCLQKHCYYCCQSIYREKYSKRGSTKAYYIDRVDSTKPYQYDNIVNCCTFCNIAKSTLSVAEFIENCTRVANWNAE